MSTPIKPTGILATELKNLELGELSYDPTMAITSIGTGAGMSSILAGVTAIMNSARDPYASLPEVHVPTKTVFSDPMEIRISIPEYELSRSDASYAANLLTDAGQKLQRTVDNETRCGKCEHMGLKVHERADLQHMTKDYRVVTTCSNAKPSWSGMVCPNGQHTARGGSATVRTLDRDAPLSFKEYLDEGVPNPPADKPSTESDTAW